MQIAKAIQSDNYLKLCLNDKTTSNWHTAFRYRWLRLIKRFIEPAGKTHRIRKELSTGGKKYVFTVLAIDCLFSETIQVFSEGVTDVIKTQQTII